MDLIAKNVQRNIHGGLLSERTCTSDAEQGTNHGVAVESYTVLVLFLLQLSYPFE